jgi:hypothetical protein
MTTGDDVADGDVDPEVDCVGVEDRVAVTESEAVVDDVGERDTVDDSEGESDWE